MAEANVMSFLGKFDGGARPNRYRVTITPPPKLAVVLTNLPFLCRSTSIPASTLGIAPVAYMGREVKIAGDRTFDDWSITVYNRKDFDLRIAFESWSNQMLYNYANVESGVINDEQDYFADATVDQLDRKDEVIQTYLMKGIWPTSIGDIALAYDSNNTVEEFQVTFAVQWWETNKSTDKSGGGGGAG